MVNVPVEKLYEKLDEAKQLIGKETLRYGKVVDVVPEPTQWRLTIYYKKYTYSGVETDTLIDFYETFEKAEEEAKEKMTEVNSRLGEVERYEIEVSLYDMYLIHLGGGDYHD